MTVPQPPNQLAIERSAELWLEDGNVILVAQDPSTSKNVGFRVHRSVLARHSPFFKDLFSIPQPENDAEKYDDCPVVRMVDEAPQEVEYVLTIFYGGGTAFYNPNKIISFFGVMAALKLGTKFSCDTIRDEALRRLSITFPTRRVDFHHGVAPVETFTPSNEDLLRNRQIAMVSEDAIQAVNAARSLSLDDLLPAAFYICTQLPIQNLMHGVADKIGRVHKLSPHDLELCLNARDEFHQEGIRALYFLLEPVVSPSCSQQALCLASIPKMFTGSAATILFEGFADHQVLLQWDTYLQGVSDLCSECVAYLSALHKTKLDEIWVRLGERFEVASWPPQSPNTATE